MRELGRCAPTDEGHPLDDLDQSAPNKTRWHRKKSCGNPHHDSGWLALSVVHEMMCGRAVAAGCWSVAALCENLRLTLRVCEVRWSDAEASHARWGSIAR